MTDLTLSARELADMRGAVSSHLPGTAVIQAATRTSDGQGGETWTYTASGTVDGRLSPDMPGGENPVGGRVAEIGNWILTVPFHTTVDEDDRVVYDSVTYEVSEVLTRVPWELGRRVRLTEVD